PLREMGKIALDLALGRGGTRGAVSPGGAEGADGSADDVAGAAGAAGAVGAVGADGADGVAMIERRLGVELMVRQSTGPVRSR
ncbi:hypothetical protein, partial [Brachybacterium sp.]